MNELKELPMEYLLCRYQRHTWQHEGFFRFRSDTSGDSWVVSSFECMHCGAVREDYLSSRGVYDFRTYAYPDGYVLDRRGKGRIPREEITREMLRRSKIKDRR